MTVENPQSGYSKDRDQRSRTIIKATPGDAGCYVDGWWGQYGTARMIRVASSFGYRSAGLITLASKHLDSMGPSTSPGLTDDEYEQLLDASDEVEEWLNANVAPEGYSFGWHDGEFFLQSYGWWEQEF